ncbi:hypothetical protein M6B38_252210 [Iris pallida]|uniref:Uncharacterized protein n=1 Tax=Iris pallida TaxID=29817 RepID=A0AAX6IIX9_IRIPA|nr:hypothetical protein M6B38_252210 [Iris pallida]
MLSPARCTKAADKIVVSLLGLNFLFVSTSYPKVWTPILLGFCIVSSCGPEVVFYCKERDKYTNTVARGWTRGDTLIVL